MGQVDEAASPEAIVPAEWVAFEATLTDRERALVAADRHLRVVVQERINGADFDGAHKAVDALSALWDLGLEDLQGRRRRHKQARDGE